MRIPCYKSRKALSTWGRNYEDMSVPRFSFLSTQEDISQLSLQLNVIM